MAGVKDYVNTHVGENREQIEHHIKELLKLIGEDVERDRCGLLCEGGHIQRRAEDIKG